MTWQEGIAVAVIVAGLGAGAFLVAQRPSFWIEFGARLVKAAMPRVIQYVTKRMPPEKEKEWRDCIRRGGEWDHIRKRCKR
jgi:predicted GNAT superfamily acetyltransferase